MRFEWDEAKERANIAKHGLNFQTAALVFLDPNLREFEDLGLYDESRWNVIGRVDGQVLFVTYTERGDRIRISARGAEPHERRRYYHSI